MHNNKLFRPESNGSIIFNDTPSNSIDCAAFQPQNYMSTAKTLFNYSSFDMTRIEKSTTLPSTINTSNTSKSKYKVLFIHYIPNGAVME